MLIARVFDVDVGAVAVAVAIAIELHPLEAPPFVLGRKWGTDWQRMRSPSLVNFSWRSKKGL